MGILSRVHSRDLMDVPEADREHEGLEQREGGILLGVHQQEPHAEGEALAVAHLRVQDAVGLQKVEQAALARTQGAAEVAVTGKCSTWEEIVEKWRISPRLPRSIRMACWWLVSWDLRLSYSEARLGNLSAHSVSRSRRPPLSANRVQTSPRRALGTPTLIYPVYIVSLLFFSCIFLSRHSPPA